MLRNERYEVFPTRRQYISFINDVRIFLNERYGSLDKPGKRLIAKTNLLKYLEQHKPDIFMVDHILVGNHKARDGIFLMETLRTSYKQPIIFLSRTANNEEHVMESLPRIDHPHAWINKGYFGEEILNKVYFDKYVLPSVRGFIENSYSEEIGNLIHKMLYEKKYTVGNNNHEKELHDRFVNKILKYKSDRYLSPNDANQLLLLNKEPRLGAEELGRFMDALDQYEKDE